MDCFASLAMTVVNLLLLSLFEICVRAGFIRVKADDPVLIVIDGRRIKTESQAAAGGFS